jgi:DNA (cytosine-5)-methyltransferase 1
MINFPLSKKLKTLSLFSGAGGLDLGFLYAGFDIKYCIEIDKRFCETLNINKKYFKNSIIINSDITKVNTKEIKSEIDFIIGGPPCQSFSASGFRKGLNDKRGNLFLEFIRLLKHFKPKGFLFENVRGLTHSNGGMAIKKIKEEFEKCGYVLNVKLLNAADYGVPQLRERVFLLGSKDKKLFFAFPTHGPDSKNNKRYVSVFDAIKDVYNPKEKIKPFGGVYGHLLPLVPEGDNYHYFTSDMGYPKPIFKWRTKFSNFLYKVSRNEPCRTIQARPGKYSGPFHWKNRKMNVEELKRLMTFPKNFIFNGGNSVAHHQLGNAVPPLLSYKIALGIRSQILNDIPKQNLLEDNFILSFDDAKKIKRRKTMYQTRKNRNLGQLDLFQDVI